MNFEKEILLFLSKIRTPKTTTFMTLISKSVNKGMLYLIIIPFLLLNKKSRYLGLSLLISFTFNTILTNLIVKLLFRRTRPFNKYLEIVCAIKKPRDFSFPSGHTASSFTFATTLFIYNKPLGIIGYIYASLVAFSRMYLGVHYPTDILGGICIGLFSAIFSYRNIKPEIVMYILNKFLTKI